MRENEQYTLAIDTASQIPSVSLFEGGTETDFWVGDKNISSSETLLPAVWQILQRNNVKLSKISMLAVSTGPGSFTGVKIGLATVKGFAIGNKAVKFGVNSLEALAFAAEKAGRVKSIISGGRDDVFVQNFYFESMYKAVESTKPELKKIDDILREAEVSADLTIISDGRFKEFLQKRSITYKVFASPNNLAKFVGLTALEKIKSGQNPDYDLQPLYIREADYVRQS